MLQNVENDIEINQDGGLSCDTSDPSTCDILLSSFPGGEYLSVCKESVSVPAGGLAH